MALRSRAEERANFGPATRIELLEGDMDHQDRRHGELRADIARVQATLMKLLISITTVAITMAANVLLFWAVA